MSLIVYPYEYDSTSQSIKRVELSLNEPFSDVFGLESWRKNIWSSVTLKKIGCNLLYTLKDKDIYTKNEDLKLLETELNIIKENLNRIAIEFKIESKAIEFRLNNALEAVRIAKTNENYGVYIG